MSRGEDLLQNILISTTTGKFLERFIKIRTIRDGARAKTLKSLTKNRLPNAYKLSILFQNFQYKHWKTDAHTNMRWCLSGCSRALSLSEGLERLDWHFLFSLSVPTPARVFTWNSSWGRLMQPWQEKQGGRILAERFWSPVSMLPLYLQPWYETPSPGHTKGQQQC